VAEARSGARGVRRAADARRRRLCGAGEAVEMR
jgi:hypothetical protein